MGSEHAQMFAGGDVGRYHNRNSEKPSHFSTCLPAPQYYTLAPLRGTYGLPTPGLAERTWPPCSVVLARLQHQKMAATPPQQHAAMPTMMRISSTMPPMMMPTSAPVARPIAALMALLAQLEPAGFRIVVVVQVLG